VNYRAPALRIPEGEEFAVDLPWCTGHCPVVHRTLSDAPDQGAFGCPFAPLFEPFFLVFLLAYGEPFVPVELINLGKLVSPIICVGQFNHQN
jgi:hypothetical protein